MMLTSLACEEWRLDKQAPLLMFGQLEPYHREVSIFASDSWLWLFDFKEQSCFCRSKDRQISCLLFNFEPGRYLISVHVGKRYSSSIFLGTLLCILPTSLGEHAHHATTVCEALPAPLLRPVLFYLTISTVAGHRRRLPISPWCYSSNGWEERFPIPHPSQLLKKHQSYIREEKRLPLIH